MHVIIDDQRVNLDLLVADYDRIGSSDPIGKVVLGYNRKGLELKHWKEMIENPRRPIVHWHVLKVTDNDQDHQCQGHLGQDTKRFEGSNVNLNMVIKRSSF